MAKRRRASRGLMPADAAAIAGCIAGYRPHGVPAVVWIAVGPFVRHATQLSKPESINAAYLTARAVTDVTVWWFQLGGDLDVEELFVEENIEMFTATQLRHLAPHSRASYRSALRRIARAVTRKAPWPADPQTYSRKTLGAPYSDDELAWLQYIARNQLSEVRRRAALTVWCLSYGAGLRGPEFGTLPGCFVEDVDGHAVVNVPGAYERRVPVLSAASDDLLELAAAYPDQPLFSDRAPSRGWTSQVLAQVELPDRAPSFSSRRLRVTWQVKLAIAGVRLSELAHLAGVETSKGWDDLARWVPQREFADLHNLIASIDAAEVAKDGDLDG